MSQEFTFTYTKDDDGNHRLCIICDDPTEDGPLGNCDQLIFTFTKDGLTVDGVENGVVVGTEQRSYSDIVDLLDTP